MNNENPDGRGVRELLEAALEKAIDDAGAVEPGPGSLVVVGEVLDTHHPHIAGRVCVKWRTPEGAMVERWVQRERHLSLRKGDRVLLTLPSGYTDWIVTGALARERAVPEEDTGNASVVRLGPGEALRVVSHDGAPLVTIRQGDDGPVLELPSGNLELSAKRTLRLSADTIEIVSAHGGVDVRTDGDAVVRGRTIRLN